MSRYVMFKFYKPSTNSFKTCMTFMWLTLVLCLMSIILSNAASFSLCPLMCLVILDDLDTEWLCSIRFFVIVHASISHFCTDMSVIYTYSRVKSIELVMHCSFIFTFVALLLILHAMHTIAWQFFLCNFPTCPIRAQAPLFSAEQTLYLLCATVIPLFVSPHSKTC
jgi:hypothetical protein